MDIKALRLAHHYSQQELAVISSLSVRIIQRLEQGAAPSLETKKCLAAALNLPLADFDDDAPFRHRRMQGEHQTAISQKSVASLVSALVCASLSLLLAGQLEGDFKFAAVFMYVAAGASFVLVSTKLWRLRVSC